MAHRFICPGYGTENQNCMAMSSFVMHKESQSRTAPEGYHPIDFDHGPFVSFGDNIVQIPTFLVLGSLASKCSTPTPIWIVPLKIVTRLGASMSCTEVVAGHVLNFTELNFGFSVIIKGIGARPKSELSKNDKMEAEGLPRLRSAS